MKNQDNKTGAARYLRALIDASSSVQAGGTLTGMGWLARASKLKPPSFVTPPEWRRRAHNP